MTIASAGTGTRVVGAFHATRPLHDRLQALDTWRITTAHSDLATTLAELLGGHSTFSADRFDVQTAAHAVPAVVRTPGDLTWDLRQNGPHGLLHHCDGTYLLTPADRRGTPCGCPPLLTDRKIRAHTGTGPTPRTILRFYLADHPWLGAFRFESASWHLAQTIPALTTRLATDGPTLCQLTIKTTEFTTASGLRLPTHTPAITLGAQ